MEHTLNSITLTPNRRLAATLVKQHQQLQIKQGQLCWSTPQIMPLSSWLEKLWLECTHHSTASHPLLLTSQQEQILWEEIIRESPESQHLLQISRTAKMAQSAWELLKQWQIDPTSFELTMTEDGELFQKWAKQFRKLCVQRNWLDHAQLTEAICKTIKQNKLNLPQKINLIGFIEITPQIKHLLDRCSEQGIKISISEESNLPIHEKRIHHIALSNQETEIITMARWAKSLYEKNTFSEIKIGCIIPDLESSRDEIQRKFLEIFNRDDAFNISAGKKLAAYPVIYTAIQILNLSPSNVPLAKLSHFLRSPFVKDAEKESQKRALYDNYLRSLNISELSLTSLISKKSSLNFFSECPLFAKCIEHYLQLMSGRKKQLPPSQWANLFGDLLFSLGWPGERSLNSEEYQVIQNCWLPLLNEFSRLDTLLPMLSQKKALHYLIKMAENVIFQPQTPEAPVQVLGVLEAAGLSFDHLWIMGLDDTSWPAAPSPNPFIPLKLQKKSNMPNASAERELLYSQKLTTQFVQSSKDIIFSYPEQNQETTLRPSALIKHFPVINEKDLALNNFLSQAQRVFDQQQLETLDDSIGLPLSDQESIRGGTNIFKFQAACPFKAFSELRLNARYIDSPTEGFNAQDRGKMIHKALEIFWNEVKGSHQLQALDQTSLTTLLSDCIDHAFDQSLATQKNEKKSRYLALEKLRFKNLLEDWLSQEKMRPAFQVIACEQEHEATLGKIKFKLQVDRIDELEQGGKLIIDYKTGKYNEISSWFSQRPTEPQLPIYCTIDSENIMGISFAELNPDSLKLKGISKKPLDIAGIKPISDTKQSDTFLWEEQITQWKNTLAKLGDDFFDGIATVDPKDKEETCTQCHLQSLCRIHENV